MLTAVMSGITFQAMDEVRGGIVVIGVQTENAIGTELASIETTASIARGLSFSRPGSATFEDNACLVFAFRTVGTNLGVAGEEHPPSLGCSVGPSPPWKKKHA